MRLCFHIMVNQSNSFICVQSIQFDITICFGQQNWSFSTKFFVFTRAMRCFGRFNWTDTMNHQSLSCLCLCRGQRTRIKFWRISLDLTFIDSCLNSVRCSVSEHPYHTESMRNGVEVSVHERMNASHSMHVEMRDADSCFTQLSSQGKRSFSKTRRRNEPNGNETIVRTNNWWTWTVDVNSDIGDAFT